ncbi:MAG: hypothetical protein GY847_38835 [Proteobacteria bacterium]|nr:hypothetical protein [Pseudomonadota bacterium]
MGTRKLQLHFKILCFAIVFAGCDNNTDVAEEDNIILQDKHNYTFEGNLNIPIIETASGKDLNICWDKVTSDIQCHDVEPQADIDNIGMVRFTHMTHKQVQERLSQGEMPQSAMAGYADYNLDHSSTCAKLSDLTLFGTEFDIEQEYLENNDTVYLLLFTEGNTPGIGARMLTFIKPSDTSNNTSVDIDVGCGVLDFSASLRQLTTLDIPQDTPWIIDWSDLAKDGQNNEIVFENIDGVLLGFYEGKTIQELEEHLLDLKIIHSSIYEIQLAGGRKADLSMATNANASFTGFSGNGIWLLGLLCSACQNPAPLFLTILNPVSGD